MHRECWERFPRHRRLANPACITARALCTCRYACRDRLLAVSFEVGSEENVPGILGACANHNFTYLVRGPWPEDLRWWWVILQDVHPGSKMLLMGSQPLQQLIHIPREWCTQHMSTGFCHSFHQAFQCHLLMVCELFQIIILDVRFPFLLIFVPLLHA